MAQTGRIVALSLALSLTVLGRSGRAVAAGERRVAIVNAAVDRPAGARAAAELRAALVGHRGVDPIAPGDLARALEDGVASDPGTDPRLAEAAAELAAAGAALDRFQSKQCLAATA